MTLTPPTRPDEGTITPRLRRVGATIWGWVRGAGRGIAQGWNWLRFKPRDSLQWASALTILGLLAAAGLALWLTGRPQGGDLWDVHYDTLGWKDRLTIAGAVAAGAGAAIALGDC